MSDKLTLFLHYFSGVLPIFASGIGSGFGEGAGGVGGVRSIGLQPAVASKLRNSMFIGLLVAETGVVFSIVAAISMIFAPVPQTLGAALAELGSSLAVAIPALFAAWGTGGIAGVALKAMSRQPLNLRKIRALMLFILPLAETPLIFGFVVSMWIKSRLAAELPIAVGMKLLAAGIAIAFGSIGTALGQKKAGEATMAAAGAVRRISSKLTLFALLTQAVVQTPVILATIISVILLGRDVAPTMPWYLALTFISAALGISITGSAAAFGSGMIAATGPKYVAKDPKKFKLLLRNSLMAQAIVDSAAIYSFATAIFVALKF